MNIYVINKGQQGILIHTTKPSDLPHGIGNKELQQIDATINMGNTYLLKIDMYGMILEYIITP